MTEKCSRVVLLAEVRRAGVENVCHRLMIGEDVEVPTFQEMTEMIDCKVDC